MKVQVDREDGLLYTPLINSFSAQLIPVIKKDCDWPVSLRGGRGVWSRWQLLVSQGAGERANAA